MKEIYLGDTFRFSFSAKNGNNPFTFEPGDKLVVLIYDHLNDKPGIINEVIQINEKTNIINAFISDEIMCKCCIGSHTLEVKLIRNDEVYTLAQHCILVKDSKVINNA
jgi:hypothetical protein